MRSLYFIELASSEYEIRIAFSLQNITINILLAGMHLCTHVTCI